MNTHQILGVISKRRAERLLEDWANTREDGVGRLLKIHAAGIDIQRADFKTTMRARGEVVMVPNVTYVELPDGTLDERLADSWREEWGVVEQFEAGVVQQSVWKIAELLRKAWDAPDLRRFDWYLWKAVGISQGIWQVPLHFKFADEPPEHVTTVEAAIFHLRHNRRRALHCSNPDCTAPYFFQQKKGQKFCSTLCALPSQRASKRRWWAENRTQKKARKNK